MSLYDFECEKCGNREEDVRVHPDALTKKILCEDCGEWMQREFPLPGRPQVEGGTPIHHSTGE